MGVMTIFQLNRIIPVSEQLPQRFSWFLIVIDASHWDALQSRPEDRADRPWDGGASNIILNYSLTSVNLMITNLNGEVSFIFEGGIPGWTYDQMIQRGQINGKANLNQFSV